MNNEVKAPQVTGAEITAVIYPPCVCGHPYFPHHGCTEGCGCQGYKPTRPIEDLGTRVYRPWSTTAFWRRVVCQSLWTIEHTAERMRGRISRQRRG